ncbi:MAG: GNAT family protein [Deltaproteobacteria bacterium]|nr:GNAT family protein [Deltaproteobacteria bacterium]
MELKPFSKDDFQILSSWFPSEASLIQWGGHFLTFPLDNRQMEEMLRESCNNPPSRKCWMIVEKEGIIGHSQLAFDWRNGNSTLGRVAVEPSHRGKGLAVPMLQLLVKEAFSHPAIHRLELNVYSFNAPAIRIYTRLGFTVEGPRRSAAAVGKERWDVCGMSILRNEYID